MRHAYLQCRKSIEHALIDQRGNRHRLLEILPDAVPQMKSLESRPAVAGRVNVHHRSELFGFPPERPQPMIADFQISRCRRNTGALETEVIHAALQLLR